MPCIEAIDLTKRFDHANALEGASFRYEGGGAIGYVGPNGAGKTTTLKLFTGLLRPTRGAALVNNIEVSTDPKAGLWSVGALIETPEPYPSQTVRESLSMIGEFRGLSRSVIRERTEQYRRELDLPPLDRKTGKLSKGQKHRICLAGVLFTEPSVLFLDEPTRGLDPAERVIIRNILLRLKKDDRLVMMSSHFLQEVAEVCDHVIFIDHGKILLQDSVADLAARFKTTRLNVEFAHPVGGAALALVPGVIGVEQVSPSRFRLDFDGSKDARPKILEGCQRLAPVTTFASSSPTLEDAYLRLIRRTS